MILLALVFSVDLFSQTIDWPETIIIEEFKGKSILIKEMDCLKQRCLVGRELNYCTETEHFFDTKVLGFRLEQKNSSKIFNV